MNGSMAYDTRTWRAKVRTLPATVPRKRNPNPIRDMMVEKYRIRKGLFDTCVVQALVSSPTYIGGQVDSNFREYEWVDVSYSSSRFTEFKPKFL